LSKRNININRLEIRVTGISSPAARTAAQGLGQDLLRRLAVAPLAEGQKGAVRIGKIDSGTLQLSPGTSPNELRRAVSQRITSSIQSKLKSQKQG
jgi:hypothetical protein